MWILTGWLNRCWWASWAMSRFVARTLSPAYDLNPTTNEYQSLLINSSTNKSDLNLLLGSSEEYMIGKDEAIKIIGEVTNAIKGWRRMAASLGIAKREMELLEQILG